MPLPQKILDFHNTLAPLGKEERRAIAEKLAIGMVQRHPLGTTNPDDLLAMRHAFVYLPTDDISKYISNFMLGIDATKAWRIASRSSGLVVPNG